MPYFYIDKPNNAFEREINSKFWEFYKKIDSFHKEVFENDIPKEMSNDFRRYGALNQFNKNYHYFKVMLSSGTESHRYRSQIMLPG